MVPKPESQVAQEGAHEERPWTAGSQCPPTNVFRRADSGGRAGAERTRPQREETAQVAGEATEKVGTQRHTR